MTGRPSEKLVGNLAVVNRLSELRAALVQLHEELGKVTMRSQDRASDRPRQEARELIEDARRRLDAAIGAEAAKLAEMATAAADKLGDIPENG